MTTVVLIPPVVENLAIECKNFHAGVRPLFLSYLTPEG
jgi:hypothetical protein